MSGTEEQVEVWSKFIGDSLEANCGVQVVSMMRPQTSMLVVVIKMYMVTHSPHKLVYVHMRIERPCVVDCGNEHACYYTLSK